MILSTLTVSNNNPIYFFSYIFISNKTEKIHSTYIKNLQHGDQKFIIKLFVDFKGSNHFIEVKI